jgi:hypothetical protein
MTALRSVRTFSAAGWQRLGAGGQRPHPAAPSVRVGRRAHAAANALTVLLEVAMVYGIHLGLLGSAWGTVTAQVATTAL